MPLPQIIGWPQSCHAFSQGHPGCGRPIYPDTPFVCWAFALLDYFMGTLCFHETLVTSCFLPSLELWLVNWGWLPTETSVVVATGSFRRTAAAV